jgi:hypothetical protein
VHSPRHESVANQTGRLYHLLANSINPAILNSAHCVSAMRLERRSLDGLWQAWFTCISDSTLNMTGIESIPAQLKPPARR